MIVDKKNRIKRIAIISESFPPLGQGGITSAHYNLYHLLKKGDFVLKVFTYKDEPCSYENLNDNPEVNRSGISSRTYRRAARALSKFYKYQRKIFRKTDTNLLSYQFLNVIVSNLGSRKINKSLRKFRPDIVIIPDFGAPGFSIKKIKTAQYIHMSHHNPIRFKNNSFYGHQSIYDIMLAVKYERKALKKVNRVICPSAYMKKVFAETFGNQIPIEVIPNIVDINSISSVKKKSIQQMLSLNEKTPVVYIPSGGSRFKGERYVVEIIRRLAFNYDNKIGFYVSGGLSDLQNEELGVLEKIKGLVFNPGAVDYETNIAYIKSCSICISPTLIESFGMAILEANFCNLPAVVFDVGGTSEVIENGKNGYLVPYLDIEQLVDKSQMILNKEVEIRALSHVKKRFDQDLILKQYLGLFRD